MTNDVYPKKFKLSEDLEPMIDKMFAVGCSFQHWLPLHSIYKEHNYDEKTLVLLRRLAANDRVLPCRDDLIAEMLNRNGVASSYCGDLALYDGDIIGSKFEPPSKVKSIAVTIQHKRKFLSQ
ncbi:hypothetical protein R3F64_18400 [Halomonas sp. 5021]|uniref:hypothetical protein n=1 Tax=Halomonas sp. 5021 TaxID=3082156 RepID=UPI002FCC3391